MALAVHVGRLVSVIFSTLAVVCTYLTALTLLPKRKDIALIATTIYAFWPMLLFCEFGGQVELIDAHAPANVSDGQLLTVTLIWRARRNGLPPLTSFVHLESADGKLVSQADTPPRGNTYPTDVWAAGEIVPDAIVLKIDDSVPPGEYYLKVGLYDSATQQRLPVQDRSGEPLPDGVVNVQKVQVVRP